MKNDWIGWVVSTQHVFVSAIFLAFFATVAWRNRSNRFLFFGWLSVLILFSVIYSTMLVVAWRVSR